MSGPFDAYDAYAAGVSTCDLCGRVETDAAATLTWTVSVEHGRRRTYCEDCSRRHLRSIEGKLDHEHW